MNLRTDERTTRSVDAASSLRTTLTAAALLVFGVSAAAATTDHIHAFSPKDAARSFCISCNHGFFRYRAKGNTIISPKTSTLKGADGSVLNIVSNQYIDGEGVMELDAPLAIIDTKAFYGKTTLIGDLILPSTVTTIGDQAFYNCYSLDGRLQLPDALTSLGASVFEGCTGLRGSIVIPPSVTTIGAKAFNGCWQFDGTLTLPSVLTTIGDNAFEGCSGLTGALILPSALTTIGKNAFSGCSGFTGDLTLPASLTAIANYTFYDCSGLDGTLTLPPAITTIGSNAFDSCSGLKGALTFPSTLSSIGYSAFSNCSGFSSVTLISVPSVANYAFYRTTVPVVQLTDDSFVHTATNNYFPTLAEAPSYTRQGVKSRWSTVVMPFDLACSADYDLFTLDASSEGSLTLTLVTGTPSRRHSRPRPSAQRPQRRPAYNAHTARGRKQDKSHRLPYLPC